MQVLRLFSPDRPELGVTEVSDLLGRPKSSVSRLLRSMAEAGFLERDSVGGRYRLTLELAALGETAREATPLQRLAQPVLEGLTAATGETSNLVVLEGGEGVNVSGVQSRRTVRHIGVLGRRLPLHATAAGKALVAWMTPKERARLPGWGCFPPLTPRTLRDAAALEAELQRVRARGWASAWGELEPELAAVAAPVRDHRGEVAGALVISAPISRVPEEALPGLGATLMGAARGLSRTLGYREAG